MLMVSISSGGLMPAIQRRSLFVILSIVLLGDRSAYFLSFLARASQDKRPKAPDDRQSVLKVTGANFLMNHNKDYDIMMPGEYMTVPQSLPKPQVNQSFLARISFIAALGGVLYGYDMGIIAAAII